jgi:putative ABC transport system permease protein
VLLVYGLLLVSQPIIEGRFGLFMPIQALTRTAYLYLLAVIGAGLLIGFVPAFKAYRNSLADGLTVRL